MPIGPHGEKRPADAMANALHVAKLLVGEAEEEYVDPIAQARGRKGGQARAAKLNGAQRQVAAKAAAEARWSP